MVKAIIFDCFGVLVRDGWLPYKEHHFGHDPDLMERARMSNWRVNSNQQTYREFIHEVAQMAGIDDATAQREIQDNPPNTELFNMIREQLKPNYKIGLLSNASANWLDDLFEPWQVDLFDATVFSYEISATKPDVRMYEAIAEKLDVELGECVFIDDQERFCAGAEAVGMKAIHYQDNIQLKKTLSNI